MLRYDRYGDYYIFLLSLEKMTRLEPDKVNTVFDFGHCFHPFNWCSCRSLAYAE